MKTDAKRSRAGARQGYIGSQPKGKTEIPDKRKTVVQMLRKKIVGAGIVIGTLLILSLMVVGIMEHHTSVQGPGAGLLRTDVVLLLYAFAGILISKHKSRSVTAAAAIGARVGLLVAVVQIANHLVEVFISRRPFVLVIDLPGIFGTK